MIEKDLNKVLNYMKQYVENKYEHDSEPMLNWKDLKLVLDEIDRLNNIIDNARKYIENNQSGCENENGHFHLNFDGDIWELYEMLRRF